MPLHGQAFEKLRWRCIRRGLLELDLLLTRFLDGGYQSLAEDEAEAFSELADMDDPELWDLVTGRNPCDREPHRRVLELLRGYRA
jgi:succinate dehydrogenase flavin-adding protein (antitoxin of CptAB toxin-antitoxin module)